MRNSPEAKQMREDAAECLALVAHYSDMTRGHLEVADDCGALWDLGAAVDALRRAVRAFSPIREAMKATDRQGIAEAAK